MKCFDPKGGDLCCDDEFKRIFKNEEVEFMFDADEKKKSRGNTRIGLSYKVQITHSRDNQEMKNLITF